MIFFTGQKRSEHWLKTLETMSQCWLRGETTALLTSQYERFEKHHNSLTMIGVDHSNPGTKDKTVYSLIHYLPYGKPFVFSTDVARCPICGAKVVAEFDEWESETGQVTECGFHIDCQDEPDMGSDDWEDWFQSHWSMPYVDWMPLEMRLYKWFSERYRLNFPASD